MTIKQKKITNVFLKLCRNTDGVVGTVGWSGLFGGLDLSLDGLIDRLMV